MKIVYLSFIFLFLSCNGQERTKTEATVMTENIKSTNISFEDWSHSVTNAISKESLLENYEKENILQVAKGITEEDFNSLQRASNRVIEDTDFEELYILFYSEGEIVMSKLCYFFSDEKEVKKGCLEMEGKEKKQHKVESLSLLVIDGIKAIPISSESEYQDIVVITKIVNNKVVSECGNTNKQLNKILE